MTNCRELVWDIDSGDLLYADIIRFDPSPQSPVYSRSYNISGGSRCLEEFRLSSLGTIEDMPSELKCHYLSYFSSIENEDLKLRTFAAVKDSVLLVYDQPSHTLSSYTLILKLGEYKASPLDLDLNPVLYEASALCSLTISPKGVPEEISYEIDLAQLSDPEKTLKEILEISPGVYELTQNNLCQFTLYFSLVKNAFTKASSRKAYKFSYGDNVYFSTSIQWVPYTSEEIAANEV